MKPDFKHLKNKSLVLIALLLTVIVIFKKENDIKGFKYLTSKKIDFKTWEAGFSLNDVKKVFPDAVIYKKNKKGAYKVLKSHNEELGTLLNSCPFTNKIFGYAGRVPLLIGINQNRDIIGITLLENYESKESINAINKNEFLNQWIKCDIDSLNNLKIDAVSGATITSNAIRNGINTRISAYLNKDVTQKIAFIDMLKIIVPVALILFALISYFMSKELKKYRIILLVLNILVFGFWLGYSLSLFLYYNWIINGISFTVHLILICLFGFSIVLPLFFKKAFYCSYVCPLGCCQELCGKITKKKTKVNKPIVSLLKNIPPIILISIAFLLFIDINVNISIIEPFMAFNYQTAKVFTLVFAGTIITVSIFINKPWCNYLCPTGYLLELLREPNKKTKNEK